MVWTVSARNYFPQLFPPTISPKALESVEAQDDVITDLVEAKADLETVGGGGRLP